MSKSNLDILMVASEVAPYSRTGGLGDVMGALPSALAELGHRIRVVSPLYRSIDRRTDRIKSLGKQVIVSCGGERFPCDIYSIKTKSKGPEQFFIYNKVLFDRDEYYVDSTSGRNYEDNDIRFAVFSLAILKIVELFSWTPDVIHVNDWQTALLPLFVQHDRTNNPAGNQFRTILSIHNLAYQGTFPAERFPLLGLPESYMRPVSGPLEFYGKLNFLKGGIAAADHLTTVSKQYAKEITESAEFGCGLEGLLRERQSDLTGILNGVDYSIWSPSRDEKIPFHYHINNLSGKRMNKVELMREVNLPFREKIPLVGMVTRLADQKGIDLVTEGINQMMDMQLQFILLGNGDRRYEEELKKFEKKWPDRVKSILQFDDRMAHLIEAGADIFLMPSKYEPSGLNQMYSLKYGTVPVVRQVGGLADTIIDVDDDPEHGNGFGFSEYTSEAMLASLGRAVNLYASNRKWTRLMKSGMRYDFSWGKSSKLYADLFRRVSSARG